MALSLWLWSEYALPPPGAEMPRAEQGPALDAESLLSSSGASGAASAASAAASGTPAPSGFCRDLVALACDDLSGYLREFRTLLPCYGSRQQSPEVAAALATIAAAADGYDVAVFKKVGCGFCARAAELLETRQASAGFTMTSVVATGAAERSALELTLALPTVTFPCIFVKGVFVGGSDDLQELLDDGDLPELLAGNHLIT